MEHLRSLLEAATTIELIDWPHQEVPAALIRAGYRVLGHEPDGYKTYVIVDDEPAGRLLPLEGVDIAQAVRDLEIRISR